MKRYRLRILIDRLKFFFYRIFRRKDVNSDMAIIYAYLIIKGKKTLSQVPKHLKEQVKQALIDLDCPELAEEKDQKDQSK